MAPSSLVSLAQGSHGRAPLEQALLAAMAPSLGCSSLLLSHGTGAGDNSISPLGATFRQGSRELDAPVQPTPSSSHGRAPPALSLSSAWRPYFPAVQLPVGSPPRRQLGVRAGTAGAYPHDAQQPCCPLPVTRRICSAPSPGSIAPRSRISPQPQLEQ
ncbi:uncharacterized protein [Zea mays]|jgi:hypothetical protein|uniref:Uncharacterized protein n=1 Tax=Zea mays TaxID=4577 RepID=A0A804PSP3_MAIZE|nr:uncharacterized protein LOC100382603 [Zea mays]XP_020401892.1 uncharacterized protein LOC103633902 [Zea mays]XP_023157036.1 uncharacterized protein LOC100382603 isoform X1 [Zea mays]XP_023157037.1 uncharacterized protein LOC100382603 isoform X1 [Zea mays]|eukprot:NP_001343968.1 uncharacterized protein LOC100382603 [Zea mays]